MFRNVFGDLQVNIPDERPGKRWQRLRRITTMSRKDVAEKLEIGVISITRLELDMASKKHSVSIGSILGMAKLYGSLLKCRPLQILEYVYPELNEIPSRGEV